MKKSLLLSAVAVCTLSLSAQEESVAKMERVKLDAFQKVEQIAGLESKGDVKAAKLVKTADGRLQLRSEKSANVLAAPARAEGTGSYAIYPYYTYPNYLFMYGYVVNVLPFDTDVTYYGGMGGVSSGYPDTEAGQAQKQQDWNDIKANLTHKWTYVDSKLGDATSTEGKITVNYPIYPNLSLILPSPVYQTNDSIYNPGNRFVLMGKSYLNTQEQGLAVLPLSPLNFEVISQISFCPLAYYGDGKLSETMTMSDYSSNFLTKYVKGAIPDYASQIASVNCVGYSQTFDKPLVPEALSSVTVRLQHQATAGASFKITFYKGVVKDGYLTKGDVIVEKTFTEEAASDEKAVLYTVPFTSKNAYGETLSYAIIEDAMIMEVTDIKGFPVFAPLYAQYSYDDYRAYFATPIFSSILTTCTMVNGQTIDFADIETSIGAYGNETKGWHYSYSMQCYMDVEYPTLSAIACRNETSTDWEEIATPKEVNMNLTSKDSQYLIQFCTSAAKDGEIEAEMQDGDFLPDWLICEPKVYIQKQGNSTVQFANVYFEIDESELKGANVAEWKGNVVVKYKNQKVLIKVNGGTTGVDNIVNVAVEADVVGSEYYDLQGRRLNAVPENGIYIQKNLLSNGKTVATKVVK